MRLQKNTLLALYSAIEFASDPTRHISGAEIAAKHGVSAHHLAKVLSELARAGIVESARGVGGGYRFAANSRRLTLLDVIEVFEDLSPQGPSRPARRGSRTRAADAHPAHAVDSALATVLSEIDAMAKATFSSITLATMLRLVARQSGAARD
jgi:Rrf2 family protein